MLTSELIIQLQATIEEIGDRPVFDMNDQLVNHVTIDPQCGHLAIKLEATEEYDCEVFNWD